MSGGSGAVVYVTSARQMLALDHDPAPGDVAGVRAVVTGLRGLAEELAGVRGRLAHPGDSVWCGRTATLVTSLLELIARRVHGLVASLDTAADQLEAWAVQLAGLQEQADALDREAIVAEAAVSTVRSDIQLTAFRTGGVGVIETAHRRALVRAEDGLDDLHRRVRELEQDYEAAARVVGRRLAEATPGPDPVHLDGALAPHRLVSAAELGTRASASHIDTVADFSAAGANTLDVIGLVALLSHGDVPVAGAAKVGSTVLGSVSATGRFVLAAGAGGSWWDVGVETVALAGGGVFVRRGADLVRGATVPRAAPGDGAGAVQGELRDRVQEMAEDTWQDQALSALVGEDHTSGSSWTSTAAELGGSTGTALSVHDVEDQWDVGAGFAHTAVLAVRLPAPAGRAPARPATPAGPPRPDPTSAQTSHPPAPG